MDYFLYISIGILAGLISGLFGLGGGAVIVPLLIFAFSIQGIAPEVSTHLAIGTSLATIIFTALSSIYTHQQNNGVRWDLVKRVAPSLVIGAWLGGNFAIAINGLLLQLMFGAFMVLVALQLLLYSPKVGTKSTPGSIVMNIAGGIIGGVSAIFGIGGGTLTIPFLTYYGISIHQAVATAAVCGLPIALVAAYVFASIEVSHATLPAGSLGYIFIPAWLGIIVTSLPCARIGAKIAHRVNPTQLKTAFAWLLMFLGARFIWINV